MSRKLITTFSILLLLALAIGALMALTAYYADLPNHISQHETLLLGQSRLVPGSQAALRVLVRDSKDGSPLPGANIQVSLRPKSGGRAQTLYTGATDAQGTAQVAFQVPADADPNQTLIVQTKSRFGADTLERAVTLERDFRVLLSTDKPIYQPGQIIHVRALALSTFDLTPARGQELEVFIADGKGNKVFRQKLSTSDFGVGAVDFQLASEVNTGPYKITAELRPAGGANPVISEKTVTVEHYVLPKFDVKLETERPYYLPGERVQGRLSARYFYGKPVDGGQVQLDGFTADVQTQQAVHLEGVTDAEGGFAFDFELPQYLVGTELEGGGGRFYLQANVIDLAQHAETANLSLPVSQNALVIEAVPEGGRFRPGVENILYVLTSYPDGSPAETDLSLSFYQDGSSQVVHTGEYGLAEVHLTPQSPYQQFRIDARDAQGHTAQREFYYEGEYSEESVLLRPDRPVYQVGDTMHLDLLTSAIQGTVYLDIVRDGQTVSTRSVEIAAGHGEAAVDLTPDLYGTLELHAYKILRSGAMARDTRLVVVDNAAGLSLAITPGQDSYRPGDQGTLDIQVNGQDGQGVPAVLGLAVVDESVFALAEQDPGFARLYFLLENEILQPRYDLHGFSIPDLMEPVSTGAQGLNDPTLRRAAEKAAQASLASAVSQVAPAGGRLFSLEANSHQDAMQRATERQQKFFGGLTRGLFGLILLLPALVLGVTVYALGREKRLSQALSLTLGLALLVVLLFFLWPLGEAYAWASTPMQRLSVVLERLLSTGQGMVLAIALVGLLGYLALIGFAWRRADRPLALALALAPVTLAAFGLLVFAATQQASFNPSEAAILAGMLAYLLLPLAFLLHSGRFAAQRRPAPALMALVVSFWMLFGILPLISLGASTTTRAGRGAAWEKGGPMVMEDGLLAAPPAAGAMPAMAPMPTQTAAAQMVEAPRENSSATPEPPRLRQYFPETMLWMPEAVTGENGALHLEFPLADSITTWRVTALASSQDGRLGSGTAGLRVFQDFFIDLDLPQALTVGDEVALPVGIFNYQTEPQRVRLELETADWFELLDEPVKEVDIAANDIQVAYFRVRARQFGSHPFKVTALGSRMSDAIQKDVQVYPNGKEITFTRSDRLEPGTPANQTVSIPAEAIPGTQKLVVKIYPGILSQVVEGLDSILRMPYGCFEQTSSTTYPNVLVMDYLRSTGQASPETQMKAEEYINLGYQRLTTFEVEGSGGFSLFGEAPADRMLTAYGLQEFSDMARVHDVDPALIQRAAGWLFSQQASDGSWENDRGLVHENTWSSLGNDRLPVTAYIAWSLVEAGFADDAHTQQGLDYVREHQAQAEDPYVLALVANALTATDLQGGGKLDPATTAVLDRLAGLATQEDGGAVWKSGVATFMGSEGQTGSIETTALAALAFLRSGAHSDLGNAALTYLVREKDSYGTWYSTQATVLTLKALLQSVRGGSERANATVTVSLNGGETRTVQVTPENFDVVQLLSFEDVTPGAENQVSIQVEGEGNLMYQVTGGYYLPWDKLALHPGLLPAEDLVKIDVDYDRTELAVNDFVNVGVTVTMQQAGSADSALIDLGLPPGFALQGEDLELRIAHDQDLPADTLEPTLQRYELTGRQILVYVANLSYGHPLHFTYRLKAKFPLSAQTPSSTAYDYYNPDVNGEALPQTLTVNP